MDKRLILAVAGAGKTSHIIKSLSEDKQALIITYTVNNYHHIKSRVIKKFGHLPPNITIETYFTFLYSFCYKPFLYYKYHSTGINWEMPPAFTRNLGYSKRAFYIDKTKRLYSNRIAKLLDKEDVIKDIKDRIAKYFDQLFVDEVQDFGGHDFNFLKQLCGTEVDINFVGDFYQHTFETSFDGNINNSLYKDITKYKKHFKDMGMDIDTTSLSKSFRCSPEVCRFISSNLGIDIQSHKENPTKIELLEQSEQVLEKFHDPETVKLFYQNHLKYKCYSENWGKSKGQDHYEDVCVALNQTTMNLYKKQSLNKLAPQTKNKLYVACTRANRDIFFVEEKQLKDFKI